VASKKKSKVEAGKKRGNQKAEPAGAEAAGTKAKVVKAANKKTTNKKPASSHTVASNDGVSTKAKAVTGTKKAPAKRAPRNRRPGRKPGMPRTVAVSQGIEPGAAAALDPFEVAKQTMKGAVPAIVEAMVELAKQGSYSHAKTLLEMTGAKHMFSDEAEIEGSGEPWAKLVLERMDEAEQESLKKDLPEVVAEP
jgi:hypothetical protein